MPLASFHGAGTPATISGTSPRAVPITSGMVPAGTPSGALLVAVCRWDAPSNATHTIDGDGWNHTGTISSDQGVNVRTHMVAFAGPNRGPLPTFTITGTFNSDIHCRVFSFTPGLHDPGPWTLDVDYRLANTTAVPDEGPAWAGGLTIGDSGAVVALATTWTPSAPNHVEVGDFTTANGFTGVFNDESRRGEGEGGNLRVALRASETEAATSLPRWEKIEHGIGSGRIIGIAMRFTLVPLGGGWQLGSVGWGPA